MLFCHFNLTDVGAPASFNNLDAPNMDKQLFTMDSLKETQFEFEDSGQFSISEADQKKSREKHERKSPEQTKTKDILIKVCLFSFHCYS